MFLGRLASRLEGPRSRVKNVFVKRRYLHDGSGWHGHWSCTCPDERNEDPSEFFCVLHDTPWIEEEKIEENRSKPGFIGSEFTLHKDWNYEDGRFEEVVKTFKNERRFFTVGELEKCVVEFERDARQVKTWHDGKGSYSVDAHHVYFEGFSEYVDKNGEYVENHYYLMWGS